MKHAMRALLFLSAFFTAVLSPAYGQQVSAALPDPFTRPQTPHPPFPYRDIEVAFRNPADPEVSLAGTLTLPNSTEPFLAVLLVTGAGPQDRNQELYGHRPFQVLADDLTRRGVAVLRVDDRGVGASTGSADGATLRAIATDVAAGFAFLKSRDDIDDDRIGLVGHSLGGMIVSRFAATEADVAFVVSLSRPVVTGVEFMAEQTRQAVLAAGGTDEQADARASLQRDLMGVIKAHPHDDKTARENLLAFFSARQRPTPSDETLSSLLSPDVLDLVRYDPVATLAGLDIPVLAVFGGQDRQIPRLLDYSTLAAGLRQNAGSMIVILPGLNHFLQTAETGLPDEYGAIPETLSPRALNLIGEWIIAQMGD